MLGIIDRYILKQFAITVLFLIVALCMIFLIVDLIENIDNFLDVHLSIFQIIVYYLNFFPDIIEMLMPIGILLSTLFSISKLSGQNEITAMKSGGMSLYRLIMLLGVFALLLSVFQVYFNGWVVPQSNSRKLEMDRKLLGSKKTGGPVNNLYFRDTPLRNVIMNIYDSDSKTGSGVMIEEFSSEQSPRLTKKFEAQMIKWDSSESTWKMVNVIERGYNGDFVNARRYAELPINLRITHQQIVNIQRSSDELNFDEFREYIDMLKTGGKDVRKLMIEYYSNYAYAFSNVVVILFAVPFASVRRRGGIAVQIAAAMIICFAYLVFTKVSQTIGYSTELNPILVGWSANILFGLISLIVLWRAPK
jgi:lipopolysaccharide export system permease protein